MYQENFDEAEGSIACFFRPGGKSADDYSRHLKGMQNAAERAFADEKALAVLIHQAPGMIAPDSNVRKQVALMTTSPIWRTAKCAIVSMNPLIRGVVTALCWLRKREYEEDIFANMDVALDWLESKRKGPLPRLRAICMEWSTAGGQANQKIG